MDGSFKQKLVQGNLLIGTMITLPSAGIVEIICESKFDWLLLDLETGTFDIEATRLILQAARNTPCLIRALSNKEIWINRALNIGASGIIVPEVKTAEEAQQAVRASKYPPEGTRRIGLSIAENIDHDCEDYIDSINKETAVVLQIDNISAVDKVEDILKVHGIDCLFVWPFGLSVSMQKSGSIADKDVQEAIMYIKKCAIKAGSSFGIFGATDKDAKFYKQNGFTLIAVSMDTMLMASSAKNIISSLK